MTLCQIPRTWLNLFKLDSSQSDSDSAPKPQRRSRIQDRSRDGESPGSGNCRGSPGLTGCLQDLRSGDWFGVFRGSVGRFLLDRGGYVPQQSFLWGAAVRTAGLQFHLNLSRAFWFYSSFSMPRSMISAKLTGRPSFSVALSESERIFS
jgi:hypothetical protein